MVPTISDLDDLEQYIDGGIASLAAWRARSTLALTTIGWLDARPLAERADMARTMGMRSAVLMSNSRHHNQVATGVCWTLRHQTRENGNRSIPPKDLLRLWREAGDVLSIRELVAEARAGYRGFETQKNRVRFPYEGNHDVDALDRMLDLVEQLEALRQPETETERHRPQRDRRYHFWIERSGKTTSWTNCPDWAKESYRAVAAFALSDYPLDLPPQEEIAGFTLRELDDYWRELMAIGMHMSSAQQRRMEDQDYRLLDEFQDDELAILISDSTGVRRDAALAITDLLTMRPETRQDPALTPLVKVGSTTYPIASIVMPSSPQRNMLSLIQQDPSLYGRAGELLGAAGEHAVLGTLDRLTSTLKVGRRVKLKRDDGSVAGDLDVVVCDEASRRLAVFEIKWHLAADGNVEVYRFDQAARKKRDQVSRLRDEYNSPTTTILWPNGWPEVADFEVRWYVLTRDVLPSTLVRDDGVTLRSQQLLDRMLPRDADMDDLLKILDEPPLPPEPLRQTEWVKRRYRGLRIEAELIIA